MASLAYAEALRAAVRVEENGARFYKKAAAAAADPEAARTFARLADFEEEHRGYFSALSMALEQRESLFLNDPKGDFAATIKRLADTGVFGLTGDPGAEISPKAGSRASIDYAIAMEKDSVIFYLGLKEAMADSEEAGKVDGIVSEELRHLAILSGLKERLKDR